MDRFLDWLLDEDGPAWWIALAAVSLAIFVAGLIYQIK